MGVKSGGFGPLGGGGIRGFKGKSGIMGAGGFTPDPFPIVKKPFPRVPPPGLGGPPVKGGGVAAVIVGGGLLGIGIGVKIYEGAGRPNTRIHKVIAWLTDPFRPLFPPPKPKNSNRGGGYIEPPSETVDGKPGQVVGKQYFIRVTHPTRVIDLFPPEFYPPVEVRVTQGTSGPYTNKWYLELKRGVPYDGFPANEWGTPYYLSSEQIITAKILRTDGTTEADDTEQDPDARPGSPGVPKPGGTNQPPPGATPKPPPGPQQKPEETEKPRPKPPPGGKTPKPRSPKSPPPPKQPINPPPPPRTSPPPTTYPPPDPTPQPPEKTPDPTPQPPGGSPAPKPPPGQRPTPIPSPNPIPQPPPAPPAYPTPDPTPKPPPTGETEPPPIATTPTDVGKPKPKPGETWDPFNPAPGTWDPLKPIPGQKDPFADVVDYGKPAPGARDPFAPTKKPDPSKPPGKTPDPTPKPPGNTLLETLLEIGLITAGSSIDPRTGKPIQSQPQGKEEPKAPPPVNAPGGGGSTCMYPGYHSQVMGGHSSTQGQIGGLNTVLTGTTNVQIAQANTGIEAIKTSIGTPIAGGPNTLFQGIQNIQQWGTKFSKSLYLDRVYNALSLMLQIHNAAMLSRSLVESIGVLIESFLTTFGLKNEDDQPIDIAGTLGKSVENFIKGIVGESVYNGVSDTWKKTSAIYTAAINVYELSLSAMSGIAEGIETVSNYTGKIGNALKKGGAVLENAYQWMDENVRIKTGKLAAIQKVTDGLQTAEEVTSNLTEVTESIQETVETVNQIKTEVSDVKTKIGENETAKAETETTNKTASQSPTITKTDMQNPNQ